MFPTGKRKKKNKGNFLLDTVGDALEAELTPELKGKGRISAAGRLHFPWNRWDPFGILPFGIAPFGILLGPSPAAPAQGSLMGAAHPKEPPGGSG